MSKSPQDAARDARLDVRFQSERMSYAETQCDRCNEAILESERRVAYGLQVICECCQNNILSGKS